MILGKIEGNAHLKRDMLTNAVLFTDETAFSAYQNKKANALRLKILENRIENLEDKLNLIIKLLEDNRE